MAALLRLRSRHEIQTDSSPIVAALSLVTSVVGVSLRDHGGGQIYDDVLYLTWFQDADSAKSRGYDRDGFMSFGEANAWANQLAFGGLDDWRLPRTGFI